MSNLQYCKWIWGYLSTQGGDRMGSDDELGREASEKDHDKETPCGREGSEYLVQAQQAHESYVVKNHSHYCANAGFGLQILEIQHFF